MIENTSCPSRWYCSQYCNDVKALKKSLGCQKQKRVTRVTLFCFALQDGLEPEYMKLTEIIRNYKKLNTNKLHKRIER